MSENEEKFLSKRTDIVSNQEMYVGWAAAGSSTSAAKWRIKQVLIDANESSTELWADGNTAFDNIWDNRTALSYS